MPDKLCDVENICKFCVGQKYYAKTYLSCKKDCERERINKLNPRRYTNASAIVISEKVRGGVEKLVVAKSTKHRIYLHKKGKSVGLIGAQKC